MLTVARMRALVLLLLALVAAPVAASARCPARVTTASFTAPGSFAVGMRMLTLVDPTRETPAHAGFPAQPSRTLPTIVWYPAAADDPTRLAPGGPFPLVVSSHGLLDSNRGETYVTELLASRGFIVAAPNFPLTNFATLVRGGPFLGDVHNQPGDVSFVIDQLLELSGTTGGWLAGGVDRRRIGATGLSLGAVTTLLTTYHRTLRDHRIRAALPLAPAGGCAINRRFFSTRRPRILVVAAGQDLILPPDANVLPAIRLLRSPGELVTLVDGTHTAFSDLITADSATSYDTLGCSLLKGIAGWGNPFDGLGGPAAGLEPDRSACLRICQDPVPANPPMKASRQHELTKAIESAFFAATLGRSHDARCFLGERLARENADLQVQVRHGRR
jgi:predicted dienelactone hydrolase